MKEMRPMLAVAAPSDGIRFPVYASAKLDGIRCLIRDGVALSRKLEPIPNQFVQYMLGHTCLNGLDGELCVGLTTAPDVFQRSMSGVMSVNGEPDFVFHVFDYWNGPPGQPYAERYVNLLAAFGAEPYRSHPCMKLLPQFPIDDAETLAAMQEDLCEQGYEGLIIRSLDGPYKFGRSTAKQGWMMKLKRWSDGEAVVTDVLELMRNENELVENELGLAKRSTAKDGKVPGGMMGALAVKDVETNVPFSIGSGFSAKERAQLWADHTGQPVTYMIAGMDEAGEYDGMHEVTVQPTGRPVVGRFWKYKHFEVGVKTAPRFPISLGEVHPSTFGETP